MSSSSPLHVLLSETATLEVSSNSENELYQPIHQLWDGVNCTPAIVGSENSPTHCNDTPLIDLRNPARKKLRITRGKTYVLDDTTGCQADNMAHLISEMELGVAKSKDAKPHTTDKVSPAVAEPIPDCSWSKRFTTSEAAEALAALSASRQRRRSPVSSASAEYSHPHDEPLSHKGGNPDSSIFRSDFHRGMWAFVSARPVRREHSLQPSRVDGLQIMELLSDHGLSKTVLNVPSYVLSVVREFYANLSRSITDLSSEYAYRTFIRGQWIIFSPSVVNAYVGSIPFVGVSMCGRMNIVVHEITAGKVSVWPISGGLRASTLSYKYAIIHKIAVKNWMPAKHCTIVRTELALLLYNVGTRGFVDIGKLVFGRIIKHAESLTYKRPLCYPSLIFSIIESQVHLTSETYEVDSPPIIITDKLKNSVYHVNDIPESIVIDSTVKTPIPLVPSERVSLSNLYKERVAREISMEVEHLSRLINSCQARKNHLDALLADLLQTSTSDHTVGKTGGAQDAAEGAWEHASDGDHAHSNASVQGGVQEQDVAIRY